MIGAEPLGRGVGGGRMNQMRYWGNSNTGKGRGIVKGEEMIGKRPAAGDAEREAGSMMAGDRQESLRIVGFPS